MLLLRGISSLRLISTVVRWYGSTVDRRAAVLHRHYRTTVLKDYPTVLTMTISVLTPDRTIFTGTVTKVALPGSDGSFQLLDNHAPLVSSLTAGKITMTTGAGEYSYFDEDKGGMAKEATPGRNLTFSIDRGFVEVLNNEVNLLVQGARNMR